MQALRLPVAAALRAAFNASVFATEMRFAPAFAYLRRGKQRSGYSLSDRSRSAFAMTETELKLIAAPAIIGLSRTPKNG